jgi:TPR repeat protein
VSAHRTPWRLLPCALAVLWPALAMTAGTPDGDSAAAACGRFFDTPQNGADPQAVARSCQAAAAEDASALLHLGLLTLAGIGTPRDLAGAAGACATARQRDSSVPAGFCLAAVTEEQRRAGDSPAKASHQPASTAVASAMLAKLDALRQASYQGDPTADADLCDLHFEGRIGGFDAQQAADWCRRAAAHGNAPAMIRLGLMHLWGVGVERGLATADALCAEAHARDPRLSASFCQAAVGAEHARMAAASAPSRFASPAAWPAAFDQRLTADALAPDRVMGAPHATPSGLRYTCRDLGRWARYGEPLDLRAFGRLITQFTASDYAELDAAAQQCVADVAPYDTDGYERGLLARFRVMLPELKARQAELSGADTQRRADAAEIDRLQRAAPVAGGH